VLPLVFKTDYTFKVLENCLDGAASRQNVIAHNVSNINTPGFKRILLDFENNSLLNQLSLKTTQEKHIDIPSNVDYAYERDLSPGRSLDGNNVNLEEEMALMVKNDIYFNAALNQVNKKIAIKKYVLSDGRP
jgi:flagellar basal-body rod protein FlgB